MNRRRGRRALAAAGLVLLSACAGLVDKPVQPTLYDLGPMAVAAAAETTPSAPPLVVPELRAAGSLEGTSILYRLAYDDRHELRPYAESRWSAPVPELVRERLVAQLAAERPVLAARDAGALARSPGGAPQLLRLELQEFAHHFDAPDRSRARLRLLATLLQSDPAGERLLAQQVFEVSRPAPSADAAGGVKALAEAVDEAGARLRQWLRDNSSAAARTAALG